MPHRPTGWLNLVITCGPFEPAEIVPQAYDLPLLAVACLHDIWQLTGTFSAGSWGGPREVADFERLSMSSDFAEAALSVGVPANAPHRRTRVSTSHA